MTWMHRIRRRALWVVVCLGLTALGIVAWTTIPAWPVVGVAVATAALVLNSMTARLSETTCLSCGTDLASVPSGAHGRVCTHCGAVNERTAAGYMMWHHDRPNADPHA